MPKIRRDIDNDAILEMLKDGRYTVRAISRTFGCSTKLVRSIREKRRDEKFYDPELVTSADVMCTCCGLRKKAPGHRYLCSRCFMNADSSDESMYSFRAPRGLAPHML
jgi:hypothetical protein